MLVKPVCREPVFQLTQTFLFRLRNVLHYTKPYMETIGYECSFLVLNQSGVITLKNGMVTDLSYDDPVWDASGEKMWCSGGPEHPDIGCGFI
jgi:hypothetical protein